VDVREMEPGRELDCLIANKIMDRNDKFGTLASRRGVMDDTCGREIKGGYKERTPYYSTQISAAWEVVGKMNRPYIIASTEDGDESWVHFGNEGNAAIGETPHAICIAALLTLEDKV